MPLRVALFGFGTVGSSAARILVEQQPEGLALTHIFNRDVARKRVDWVPSSVIWSEDADAVLASDADVIVELAGGLDPAGDWVRRALESGKSVVTANKKLIAFHGVELERLAASKGGHLKYGAAVAGGIPVIPGLEQGLAGDRIERIEGILNGTCNFILSKMEAGAEYAPVLREAQSLGYAEADPTEDVGGFDARAKLSILMRLALRLQVNPEEIVPRPITTITAVDFSYARDLGCTIRQIARADRTSGTVAATVGPMLVDLRSPLAWSRGTENMVIAPATTVATWSSPATVRVAIPLPSPWSAICSPSPTARAACRCPPNPPSSAANSRSHTTSASWSRTAPASLQKSPEPSPGNTSTSAPSCRSPVSPPTLCPSSSPSSHAKALHCSARSPPCAPWIVFLSSRSTCKCWSRRVRGSRPRAAFAHREFRREQGIRTPREK